MPDSLQYLLIVIGGVTWTALICWMVYFITTIKPPKE